MLSLLFVGCPEEPLKNASLCVCADPLADGTDGVPDIPGINPHFIVGLCFCNLMQVDHEGFQGGKSNLGEGLACSFLGVG